MGEEEKPKNVKRWCVNFSNQNHAYRNSQPKNLTSYEHCSNSFCNYTLAFSESLFVALFKVKEVRIIYVAMRK